VIELYTWREYSKDELVEIDWEELSKQVKLFNDLRNLIPAEYREKIEERSPTISEESFNPQGWVGSYFVGEKQLRVVPDPDLIPKDQFEEMMNELTGWLEYLGPFVEDFLKFCTFEPIFKFLLYESYSRRLIEYTEIVLSHFIPRSVLAREQIGPELRGKPLWKKILSLQTKATCLLAYYKVEFSLRTLTNLLLVRFHTELLREMKELITSLAHMIDMHEIMRDWKVYAKYHEAFINSHPWEELVDESLETIFESLEIIEKARHATKGVWSEILDLWEAYKSRKAFFSRYGERFDNALKPLSKIYEIWCLKKLCDIFNIDRKEVKSFPCKIRFEYAGKALKLYYNTKEGLTRYSEIMSKIPGVSPGIPDFVIEDQNKIVCIMDAKCKSELSTDDAQRFLSYLYDYMYPHNTKILGMIFYIPKDTAKIDLIPIKVKGTEIYLVPMSPSTYAAIKNTIESIIQSTIN